MGGGHNEVEEAMEKGKGGGQQNLDEVSLIGHFWPRVLFRFHQKFRAKVCNDSASFFSLPVHTGRLA